MRNRELGSLLQLAAFAATAAAAAAAGPLASPNSLGADEHESGERASI